MRKLLYVSLLSLISISTSINAAQPEAQPQQQVQAADAQTNSFESLVISSKTITDNPEVAKKAFNEKALDGEVSFESNGSYKFNIKVTKDVVNCIKDKKISEFSDYILNKDLGNVEKKCFEIMIKNTFNSMQPNFSNRVDEAYLLTQSPEEAIKEFGLIGYITDEIKKQLDQGASQSVNLSITAFYDKPTSTLRFDLPANLKDSPQSLVTFEYYSNANKLLDKVGLSDEAMSKMEELSVKEKELSDLKIEKNAEEKKLSGLKKEKDDEKEKLKSLSEKIKGVDTVKSAIESIKEKASSADQQSAAVKEIESLNLPADYKVDLKSAIKPPTQGGRSSRTSKKVPYLDATVLKNQIATLEGMIAANEKEIATLEGMIAANEKEIASIEEKLKSLNENIAERESKVKSLQENPVIAESKKKQEAAKAGIEQNLKMAVQMHRLIISSMANM